MKVNKGTIFAVIGVIGTGVTAGLTAKAHTDKTVARTRLISNFFITQPLFHVFIFLHNYIIID